jgi:hypothetical protein
MACRGAIFLFDCMNASGCMAWIMRELKAMSGGHPVAEVCVPFTKLGMLAQTDRLGSRVLVVSCRAPCLCRRESLLYFFNERLTARDLFFAAAQ